MASPFEVHPGLYQQRTPTPFADETGYAYELGHAKHLEVRLASGDLHSLSQTFTPSPGSTLIRARVRIESAPMPAPWEFVALLNGEQHYRRRITDRIVFLNDVVIRLSEAGPGSIVEFQLRLM